jgi:hypothetical protein
MEIIINIIFVEPMYLLLNYIKRTKLLIIKKEKEESFI